jgi:hypothetical protein
MNRTITAIFTSVIFANANVALAQSFTVNDTIIIQKIIADPKITRDPIETLSLFDVSGKAFEDKNEKRLFSDGY